MKADRKQRGKWSAHAQFLFLILTGLVSANIALAVFSQSAPAIDKDAQVNNLLRQMTLKEKIMMIHGAIEPASTFQGQAGYVTGVPRLHIPSLRLADGPPGVLTRVPSTAPTSTMGLAATFSIEDAKQNGVVIAHEARSHGIDVVLQPFLNIDRDIAFGRGYNTFGEDPFLTGQMGAAEIRGIQGQGLMSQAKHYVAYDTTGTNVFVDQQTLHQVYVAPFAAASEAGVSSIMCSYNKVNGKYACGNPDTLNKILKGEVGFKGFVTSDWGATHGTDFINAGVDMEMPGPIFPGTPSYFVDSIPRELPHKRSTDNAIAFGLPEEPKNSDWSSTPEALPTTSLMKDVKSGVVSEETITRAAGRVLYQMDEFGLLDGKSKHDITPSDIEANAPIIQKTSEDSAVLLKNDGQILPLKKKDLESLAMIGPGAGQTVAVGLTGEKAVGLPEREIGALQAIKKLTEGDTTVHITYSPAQDPAHPERTGKGVDGKTTFSEGIFVGYRWFDKNKTKPLFPFGFGLSYTTFSYSGLRIVRATDGGLDVSFNLKNTGHVAGDEVPQIYLGGPKDKPANAQFAVRSLCGFDRVYLHAGESRTVAVHVPLRSLQYWSTASDRWSTAAGPRLVYVGASSRDLRLNAPTIIEP